ncbi:MAG: response regulator transcription factor [Bacteroidetes bacterium]|nr:response regulator transcription factor [Bacteroidota bacterium]
MNEKIKIGLVEDQALFRTGIKAILSSWPGFEVVFESADGYSVIEKLKQGAPMPDVMLVDLSLPPNGDIEYTGEQLTVELTRLYPDLRIIILSVHDDENFIARLIESGAHGYLVKDCDPQEVHDAIVAAHTKGSYINERTLRAIQKNMGKKQKPIKTEIEITKREIEILQLTCQQYTADEIADKLFISVKTVNGHRNNLLQKTGSKNVTGLVIYAIKNQIVNLA